MFYLLHSISLHFITHIIIRHLIPVNSHTGCCPPLPPPPLAPPLSRDPIFRLAPDTHDSRAILLNVGVPLTFTVRLTDSTKAPLHCWVSGLVAVDNAIVPLQTPRHTGRESSYPSMGRRLAHAETEGGENEIDGH